MVLKSITYRVGEGTWQELTWDKDKRLFVSADGKIMVAKQTQAGIVRAQLGGSEFIAQCTATDICTIPEKNIQIRLSRFAATPPPVPEAPSGPAPVAPRAPLDLAARRTQLAEWAVSETRIARDRAINLAGSVYTQVMKDYGKRPIAEADLRAYYEGYVYREISKATPVRRSLFAPPRATPAETERTPTALLSDKDQRQRLAEWATRESRIPVDEAINLTSRAYAMVKKNYGRRPISERDLRAYYEGVVELERRKLAAAGSKPVPAVATPKKIDLGAPEDIDLGKPPVGKAEAKDKPATLREFKAELKEAVAEAFPDRLGYTKKFRAAVAQEIRQALRKVRRPDDKLDQFPALLQKVKGAIHRPYQKLGSKLPSLIPRNQNRTGPKGAEFSRDKVGEKVEPLPFGLKTPVTRGKGKLLTQLLLQTFPDAEERESAGRYILAELKAQFGQRRYTARDIGVAIMSYQLWVGEFPDEIERERAKAYVFADLKTRSAKDIRAAIMRYQILLEETQLKGLPPPETPRTKEQLAIEAGQVAVHRKNLAAVTKAFDRIDAISKMEESARKTVSIKELLALHKLLVDFDGDDTRLDTRYAGTTNPEIQTLIADYATVTLRYYTALPLLGELATQKSTTIFKNLETEKDKLVMIASRGLRAKKELSSAQDQFAKRCEIAQRVITSLGAIEPQKEVLAQIATLKQDALALEASELQGDIMQDRVGRWVVTLLNTAQRYLDRVIQTAEGIEGPGLPNAIQNLKLANKILKANPGHGMSLLPRRDTIEQSIVTIQARILSRIESLGLTCKGMQLDNFKSEDQRRWLSGTKQTGQSESVRDSNKKDAQMLRQSIEILLGKPENRWDPQNILIPGRQDLRTIRAHYHLADRVLSVIADAEQGRLPEIHPAAPMPESAYQKAIRKIEAHIVAVKEVIGRTQLAMTDQVELSAMELNALERRFLAAKAAFEAFDTTFDTKTLKNIESRDLAPLDVLRLDVDRLLKNQMVLLERRFQVLKTKSARPVPTPGVRPVQAPEALQSDMNTPIQELLEDLRDRRMVIAGVQDDRSKLSDVKVQRTRVAQILAAAEKRRVDGEERMREVEGHARRLLKRIDDKIAELGDTPAPVEPKPPVPFMPLEAARKKLAAAEAAFEKLNQNIASLPIMGLVGLRLKLDDILVNSVLTEEELNGKSIEYRDHSQLARSFNKTVGDFDNRIMAEITSRLDKRMSNLIAIKERAVAAVEALDAKALTAAKADMDKEVATARQEFEALRTLADQGFWNRGDLTQRRSAIVDLTRIVHDLAIDRSKINIRDTAAANRELDELRRELDDINARLNGAPSASQLDELDARITKTIEKITPLKASPVGARAEGILAGFTKARAKIVQVREAQDASRTIEGLQRIVKTILEKVETLKDTSGNIETLQKNLAQLGAHKSELDNMLNRIPTDGDGTRLRSDLHNAIIKVNSYMADLQETLRHRGVRSSIPTQLNDRKMRPPEIDRPPTTPEGRLIRLHDALYSLRGKVRTLPDEKGLALDLITASSFGEESDRLFSQLREIYPKKVATVVLHIPSPDISHVEAEFRSLLSKAGVTAVQVVNDPKVSPPMANVMIFFDAKAAQKTVKQLAATARVNEAGVKKTKDAERAAQEGIERTFVQAQALAKPFDGLVINEVIGRGSKLYLMRIPISEVKTLGRNLDKLGKFFRSTESRFGHFLILLPKSRLSELKGKLPDRRWAQVHATELPENGYVYLIAKPPLQSYATADFSGKIGIWANSGFGPVIDFIEQKNKTGWKNREKPAYLSPEAARPSPPPALGPIMIQFDPIALPKIYHLTQLSSKISLRQFGENRDKIGVYQGLLPPEDLTKGDPPQIKKRLLNIVANARDVPGGVKRIFIIYRGEVEEGSVEMKFKQFQQIAMAVARETGVEITTELVNFPMPAAKYADEVSYILVRDAGVTDKTLTAKYYQYLRKVWDKAGN